MKKKQYKTSKEIDAAGVVFYNGSFLIMYDRLYKFYDLPQGHQESGEGLKQTALREIVEETGYCDLRFHRKLGRYQYHFKKSDTMIYKTINIYLIELLSKKRKVRKEHESKRYSINFESYENALQLLQWPQDKKSIKRAHSMIRKIS